MLNLTHSHIQNMYDAQVMYNLHSANDVCWAQGPSGAAFVKFRILPLIFSTILRGVASGWHRIHLSIVQMNTMRHR